MTPFNAIRFKNNGTLHKNGTPCKKMPKNYYPICQALSLANRVVYNMYTYNIYTYIIYDSDSLSWDFKIKVFPLQSDIPITFLCLTVGVGSIRRVLVVLQKNNNIVVRRHFCEMPFMLGVIFVTWCL